MLCYLNQDTARLNCHEKARNRHQRPNMRQLGVRTSYMLGRSAGEDRLPSNSSRQVLWSVEDKLVQASGHAEALMAQTGWVHAQGQHQHGHGQQLHVQGRKAKR